MDPKYGYTVTQEGSPTNEESNIEKQLLAELNYERSMAGIAGVTSMTAFYNEYVQLEHFRRFRSASAKSAVFQEINQLLVGASPELLQEILKRLKEATPRT